MTTSKQLAENAGYVPRLTLGVKTDKGVQSTGPHVVTYLADRVIKGVDYPTREERDEVEFVFEENGEKKHYNVQVKNKKGGLHYFVGKMSEFPYGKKLVLEMKNRGAQNYVEIQPLTDNNEIPIIE